jgi:oxygen-independent coproporphyrinogen-3 oxidase
VPGIYFHIPFCKQACNYCDFHFSTSLGTKEAVIAAIVREIELRHGYLEETGLESLYFGGGTPSLLAREDLSLLLEALARHFSWDTGTEITLEANPDDITPAALRDWKALGINRLSIGLQSFNNEELRWMNRAHTAGESLSSVKMAQDHGFENITIDLIYGSKFQDLASWENTLNRAIALKTPHISSYNLTIEKKTALGVRSEQGKEPAPDEGLSSAQFLLLIEMMDASGFIQYEISNFGKNGFFARHNSNYWLGQHYLGLGPSAHSYNGSSRQWNLKNNPGYVKAVNEGGRFYEEERLSLKDRYNEYVLTRLRTLWGCDVSEMTTLFGNSMTGHFKKHIQPLREFVDEKAGVFTLNKRGKLIADGLASDLFFL